MKNRIKVFQGYAVEIENSVNQWIIEKEKNDEPFEIVQITTSGSRAGVGSPICIITIHYKTK